MHSTDPEKTKTVKKSEALPKIAVSPSPFSLLELSYLFHNICQLPPARAATKCLEYEDVHDLAPSKSLEKANKYLKKAKSGPPFGSSRKNRLILLSFT